MPVSHLPARRWTIELVAVGLALLAALVAAPVRAAALDEAMGAVFSVHSADNEDRFLGSAFLWGETAVVAVTNAHVVGDAAEVRLRDQTGAEEIATVIARDPIRDVAVLSVKPGRRGLIAATDLPGLGAEVWALGAPLGIEFSLTNGRISALARQVDPRAPLAFLQHDAAVNPGSSGGPLVDGEGHILGMNSQIADGSRMFVGIAYAISAADLDRIVVGLIEETLLPLPTLGLKLRPVDRQLAAVLQIKPTGLLVDEVSVAGLAEAAGMRPGDVLLALGGVSLTVPGDLAFAVEAAQAKDDSADLAVMREGEMLLLSLDLRAAETGGVLALRDISGAMPRKVQSYSVESLGLQLDAQGVVTSLTPNSPALLAGIALGDRVVQVNGAALTVAEVNALTFTAAALFLVETEGHSRHVLIDPFSETKGLRPVGGANVLDPDVVVF